MKFTDEKLQAIYGLLVGASAEEVIEVFTSLLTAHGKAQVDSGNWPGVELKTLLNAMCEMTSNAFSLAYDIAMKPATPAQPRTFEDLSPEQAQALTAGLFAKLGIVPK